MKISQLERESGISKSTIHYYLNLGLLPRPLHQGLNLQLYDQRHLECLQTIKGFREKERLSLKKIKKILERRDSALDNKAPLTGKLINEPAKDEHDENTIKVEQLIETAARLFSCKGYESVRISDITDALHMGKSTFYVYFGSKEEIFLACIEKLSLLVVPEESWAEIIKEKDFFKKQVKRLRAFLKAFSGYSGMIHLAKHFSSSTNEKIATAAKNAIQFMTKALEKDIRRAQKAGYIRKIDPDIISHMVLGMAESLGYRLSMDSKFSLDDALRIYTDFLKHGLGLEIKK